MRGTFITLEGPEGGGKSTQAARLADYLRAQGHSVLLTREPGGTRLAELIRTLVREEVEDAPCPKSEVLLFLAARAQVVEKKIRPALARGNWVVCDRYQDSTFAYQGWGRQLPLAELKHLNQFATTSLTPDHTFLLDVPLEVSAERMHARGENFDRMERAGQAFHARLREGFLRLAQEEPSRIHLIDATQSQDCVFEAMCSFLPR